MDMFLKFLFTIFLFIFLPFSTRAIADLEITPEGIWVSMEKFFVGDRVKIYAVVENRGTEDMVGFVVFFENGSQIGEPHFISARAGGKSEEVWVEWIPQKKGTPNIQAKIVSTYPPDENTKNDETDLPPRFIDLDTDKDGIGNEEDPDDDNDTLPDEWEEKYGLDPLDPKDIDKDYDGDGISNREEYKLETNPRNPDSDEDGISDKEDEYPLNPKELKDTDKDSIGDEEDSDDDNDGLYDFEEKRLDTDPKNRDTDKDGVGDKEDAFPLDSKKWEKPKKTKRIELEPIKKEKFPKTEKIHEASPKIIAPPIKEKLEKISELSTIPSLIKKESDSWRFLIFPPIILLSSILFFYFIKEFFE